MDMRQDIRAFAQHRPGIVAEIERVRRTVEKLYARRIHCAYDVDRRLQGLAPVFRVRLDMEIDALSVEDRHKLIHRPPPGVLAGFDHRAGMAAIAGALVRM